MMVTVLALVLNRCRYDALEQLLCRNQEEVVHHLIAVCSSGLHEMEVSDCELCAHNWLYVYQT